MRTTALRAPAALAVLLAIITVPPVALWHFRSVYLPDHVPNVAEALAWLTTEDNGRLFLLLLVGAGFVAWLQLVVAIALELFARVHGATVPHLPGFGWAQRIATALLLVVLTGTAAEAAEPAGDQPQPTHVVVPGDSLTKIAADELGSSTRYREVFDLNHGRRQPDGRSLQDPSRLRPGWILQLPHDSDCREIVVRPGQTLSQIAREQLGDAGRYREIFDLNRGRPQPSGRPLEDVDSIHPGDILRLPTLPKQHGGGGAVAANPHLAALTSCEPAGPPPAVGSQPAKPPLPPHGHTPATERPSPRESSTADDSTSFVVGGIGGLLAAGLLTAFAVRRRQARQRRRPGHRIRVPKQGTIERELHAVEVPATVEVLDRALRTLSRAARDTDVALPALRAVKLGSHGLELRLTDACEPIAPFTAATSSEWTLSAEAELEATAGPAPYPTLVSLGHIGGGDLVLIDLRQAGVVTLKGDRAAAEAVLLALAWDLAVAPWAERTVLTLVSFGESSAAVRPDRFRYFENWDDALHQDFASEATHVLLAAAPPGAEHVRRSTELLDGACAVDLAAVVTVDGDGLSPVGAWRLEIGASSTFVAAWGEEVELQKLTPSQVEELVVALASADDPVQVPVESYRNVPPEETGVPEPLRPLEPAVQLPPRPALQVLGPVRLTGADPGKVEAKKLNRLVELAAFLALHPGATADEISLRLGTDAQPWSAATRQGYISRLRTWLGRDATGNPYVPNVDARHGGYRMSESFGCDWSVFQDLALRGLARPEVSVPDLQQALDLVHGTPFGNVPAGRYAWSSWLQREMTDSIVDVAHTLADAYQKAGDLPAARRAAMRGLQAEPVSEILYRDLLRTEYRAGNLAAVRETADKLSALAASLELELDEETSALVASLLSGRK
ncbi:LysM domain-containing protein [Amycolatopsis pretoriensis]|uniref:LysM domain-containing protein n=1 Tax=Amycolatopsis pretoriensis TaxID=218821 RepID=A0A1H5RJ77_9PSEU|nr:BTAD domain-containing putative transcriptional regulator [Amycolatopsis pretoriensis]SEF38405.1 LysM domain-containing protein [Amycolatopsis pretoriensis]